MIAKTLRKSLALMALALVLMTGPLVQESQAQLRFGIAGGLNFAQFNDISFSNASATFDNRSGFHGGIFFDFGIGPLSIRPGVFYLQAGNLFDGLADDLSVSGFNDNFDVNFISIPIDIRIGGLIYVFAGPDLRIVSESGADPSFSESLKSFNVAANAGVGLELGFGGITLMPEFRYMFDLSGLTEQTITIGGSNFNISDDFKVKGYMLRLGLIL